MTEVIPAGARLVAAFGEVRTIVYVTLPGVLLARRLPDGWRGIEIASGPARGANLRISFTEQIMALDGSGRPRTGPRVAYLVVPAVRGRDATMLPTIVGSYLDAEDTSSIDFHGDAVAATSEVRRASLTTAGGARTIEEAWSFRTRDGDQLSLDIAYTTGPQEHARPEFRMYSAARPENSCFYRVEHVQDSVMSRPNGIDRTRRLVFSATGPQLSTLFAEARLVGVATLPWTRREVWTADAASAA